jgi:hypothetical protein
VPALRGAMRHHLREHRPLLHQRPEHRLGLPRLPECWCALRDSGYLPLLRRPLSGCETPGRQPWIHSTVLNRASPESSYVKLALIHATPESSHATPELSHVMPELSRVTPELNHATPESNRVTGLRRAMLLVHGRPRDRVLLHVPPHALPDRHARHQRARRL